MPLMGSPDNLLNVESIRSCPDTGNNDQKETEVRLLLESFCGVRVVSPDHSLSALSKGNQF